jgi:hypothetical protein
MKTACPKPQNDNAQYAGPEHDFNLLRTLSFRCQAEKYHNKYQKYQSAQKKLISWLQNSFKAPFLFCQEFTASYLARIYASNLTPVVQKLQNDPEFFLKTLKEYIKKESHQERSIKEPFQLLRQLLNPKAPLLTNISANNNPSYEAVAEIIDQCLIGKTPFYFPLPQDRRPEK